jgi:hypothetical protein
MTTLQVEAVRVLDSLSPPDRAEWLDLWESWPQRDVMAHPDYVRLFARPGDRVVAASLRTARGGVLYPLIQRPLASEPWTFALEARCDLTAPYGYGGPFAWGATEDDAVRFWKGFEDWSARNGAVASFARLSLFPERLLPLQGEVIQVGLNVVRRLDLPEAELLSDMKPKVRQNVRRARRNGVTVEFDENGRRLDEFISVYTETMDRRKAAPMYYFPRAFFEGLVRDLDGSCFLAHAIADGRVVSSEIILLSKEHAVYFLGGSRVEALQLAANEVLKLETLLRCRDLGKKALVLGGGLGTQPASADGLLQYKLSFAPRGAVPFKVVRMIHDAPSCAELVDRRRSWESGRGQTWEPAGSFFPAYRA